MAVYYLHDIVHGAKWVRFLDKVFCETGIVAVTPYKHTQAGMEGPQVLYLHNYSHPRTEFSMWTTLPHK